MHHFADDANLLYLGKSAILYWLNAKKISLNVKKTELVIFKSKLKQFDGEIKVKLSRKDFSQLTVLNI